MNWHKEEYTEGKTLSSRMNFFIPITIFNIESPSTADFVAATESVSLMSVLALYWCNDRIRLHTKVPESFEMRCNYAIQNKRQTVLLYKILSSSEEHRKVGRDWILYTHHHRLTYKVYIIKISINSIKCLIIFYYIIFKEITNYKEIKKNH